MSEFAGTLPPLHVESTLADHRGYNKLGFLLFLVLMNLSNQKILDGVPQKFNCTRDLMDLFSPSLKPQDSASALTETTVLI